MHRAALLAFVVLAFAPRSTRAAKVKVWHQHAPGHYDKAQLKHAVVSSEGALRLSRQLKPLAGLDATHVWDVVEDKDGNLFVATGDEGKIYKVTPDGKVSRRLRPARTARSSAWPLAPDGTVYAGTGPSGLIVRIDPDGKAQVICRQPGQLRLVAWPSTARARRSTPAPGRRAASTRSTAKARRASSTPPSRSTSSAWRWRRRHALRRHRQGRPGLSHRPQGQGLRAVPGAPGRGPQPAGDARRCLRRHQLADASTSGRFRRRSGLVRA